jgi:hypothetical protein
VLEPNKRGSRKAPFYLVHVEGVSFLDATSDERHGATPVVLNHCAFSAFLPHSPVYPFHLLPLFKGWLQRKASLNLGKSEGCP